MAAQLTKGRDAGASRAEGSRLAGAAGRARTYLELVAAHPLKLIRSDAELDEAVAFLNALIDREFARPATPDELEYQQALMVLIGFYEADHVPEPTCSPAGMLRHLLENHDTPQAKLAADTGVPEAAIAAILAGKRRISAKNKRIFAAYFKTDPSVFD